MSRAGMRLIIVESPKKARTIASFAGPEYRVIASMGHVRDLPTRTLGVEIDREFVPQYEVIERAKRTLTTIRAAMRTSDSVLLATDPDREGEAIAWHLVEALRLPRARTSRIIFHEISERALRGALSQPRALDHHLVDAQQARRVLDRLVGYGASPLLWKAVATGTSAGRVQSVALRLIVDREREIQTFETREFWTIDVALSTVASDSADEETSFVARLTKIGDEPADLTGPAVQTDLRPNSNAVDAVVAALDRALYRVESTASERGDRSPPPPFTTSTLQQTASIRLRLPAKRVMQLAQDLYESGLITYMRTDSVVISSDGISAIRAVIRADFGATCLPASPRHFRTRSRNAQEAHEAIRPVDPARRATTVGTRARGDALRLYALIWSRAVASQMVASVTQTDRVVVVATDEFGEGLVPGQTFMLEARASKVVAPGWLRAHGWVDDHPHVEGRISYENASEERATNAPMPNTTDQDQHEVVQDALPTVIAGQVLAVEAVLPTQRFTKPPPRYSEATLVRTLEAAGVGRPSTYASIISTIEERAYVTQSSRVFVPTDLGCAVTDYLVARFPDIVDTEFTAAMEGQLDDIASGTLSWQEMLRTFYDRFTAGIRVAQASLPTDRRPTARQPQSAVTPRARGADTGVGKRVKSRSLAGKDGAKRDVLPEDATLAPVPDGVPATCPRCGHAMVSRQSSYGQFWACGGFPQCRYVYRSDGATRETTGTTTRARRRSATPAPDPMTRRVVRSRRLPRTSDEP